jgi:hypothetical protein
MRQIEPDPTAVNRLMMGPDGTVHVIPAGTAKAPPPGEMEGRPAAAQQASASICEDLSANVAKRDTGLRGVRRVPEVGVCFSFSAGRPATDRDAVQRALRDIRRVPGTGAPCFSY